MFKKMKIGSEGLQVKEAQEMLRKAGSNVKTTGMYTIGMYSAVKAFQKKNGLKQTGEIDNTTWKKLLVYKKKIVKMGPNKVRRNSNAD